MSATQLRNRPEAAPTELNIIDQHLSNLGSLIALKLNNLTELLIFDKGAVAGKLLLEVLDELLWVELVRDALHGGQGLSPVSLLDANVDITWSLGGLVEIVLCGEVIGIGKGI